MKQVVNFPIEGMRCDACANKLHKALASLPGVQELSVSLTDRRARVVFETGDIHINRLADAIREAGFQMPQGCP